MTVNGTISATSVLFVLLLAAAVAGWQAMPEPEVELADQLDPVRLPGHRPRSASSSASSP